MVVVNLFTYFIYNTLKSVSETNLNYHHQYSKTNRPNVDMKVTPTYITKLVLNANKRDRGPLWRTFYNEYFMIGPVTTSTKIYLVLRCLTNIQQTAEAWNTLKVQVELVVIQKQ